MKIFVPAVLCLVLATSACTSQPGPGEHVYWVNSLKIPCVGVGPTHCLQVYKGDELDPSEWESFFASIEGFDFESGYVYKLLVKESERDEAEVRTDASSMVYTLVRVLDKKKDPRLVLHHKWMLESLNGKTIARAADPEYLERPSLEIHVGEMRYSGTDGCNTYFGGIVELSEDILRLGIGAGTRKMCPDMEVPDEFNRTLPQVTSYKVKDLKLQLYDEEGKEVMQFQKTDP